MCRFLMLCGEHESLEAEEAWRECSEGACAMVCLSAENAMAKVDILTGTSQFNSTQCNPMQPNAMQCKPTKQTK